MPFWAGGPLRDAVSVSERLFVVVYPPWRLGGSGASEVAAVAPSDAVGGPVVDGGGCPAADLSAALSVGDDDVRRWEEILAGVGGESARAQADALGEAGQT